MLNISNQRLQISVMAEPSRLNNCFQPPSVTPPKHMSNIWISVAIISPPKYFLLEVLLTMLGLLQH